MKVPGWELVDKVTEIPAEVGQDYTTFRGEAVVLKRGFPPTARSSGRIVVEDQDGEMVYYPGVIGMKWIRRN